MNPPSPARKYDREPHASSRAQRSDFPWESLSHVRDSLNEIFEALERATPDID